MRSLRKKTDEFLKGLYGQDLGSAWAEIIPAAPLEPGCPIVGGNIALSHCRQGDVVYTQRGSGRGMRFAFEADLKGTKIDLDEPVGYAYALYLLRGEDPPTDRQKLEVAFELSELIEGGSWR